MHGRDWFRKMTNDLASLTRCLRPLNTEIRAASVTTDMRITTALAAAALFTASLLQLPGSAQADPRAKLQLRVVDQTNAVLPHASVTIFTLDGKPGVTATADDKGVVVFPTVAPGMTQIVAKFPGFATMVNKATLKPGDNAQTLMLRLAPVSERVTVRATPAGNRS